MRYSTFISIFVFVVSAASCSPSKNFGKGNKQAIENIKFVFEDYIKYQESTDSKEDKELMSQSLGSLNIVTDRNELDLLINVWMYYDPTDYPDRHLIFQILKNSRPESIQAVKLRRANKKQWEAEDTAPYSELNDLLKELGNEENPTLELMQGLWFHAKDSLASIKIHHNQWVFNYRGQKNDSGSIYAITITNKLPEFVKETEKAEFLILTNNTDTLQYEILTLTNITFSLMHFPSGKIHLYRRQE